MTGSVTKSPLQIPYEIGRHIQTFVTTDSSDESGKPWSNYPEHFSKGPNPCYSQLKTGLVLVTNKHNVPQDIDTVYGRWDILGSMSPPSGDYEKVDAIFQSLKGTLGLVKLDYSKAAVGYHYHIDESYLFYTITQWDGQKLEPAVYKTKDKFTSYKTAKKEWDAFSSKHADIAPRREEGKSKK